MRGRGSGSRVQPPRVRIRPAHCLRGRPGPRAASPGQQPSPGAQRTGHQGSARTDVSVRCDRYPSGSPAPALTE